MSGRHSGKCHAGGTGFVKGWWEMESNEGRGKLDEQARKRVEAVLQSELSAEANHLERIKSIVHRELANEEGAAASLRATDQIFIGIILDGKPVGVYF